MFYILLPLHLSIYLKTIKTMTTEKEKNWSQIRETILLLNVAVARIEHAMLEGNDSFTSLSLSFIETVNSSVAITAAANQLEDSDIKDKIKENCQDITLRVSDSIISFQFYDKLSQRMTLVSKTLASLTAILKDQTKIDNHEEWVKLQETIRSKYTLDADQEMFDAVIKGMPIDEALKIAVEKNSQDDIELF